MVDEGCIKPVPILLPLSGPYCIITNARDDLQWTRNMLSMNVVWGSCWGWIKGDGGEIRSVDDNSNPAYQ